MKQNALDYLLSGAKRAAEMIERSMDVKLAGIGQLSQDLSLGDNPDFLTGRFLKEKKALTKRGKVSNKKNYFLSEDYPFIDTLRLLFNSEFFSNRRLIANRFKKCGRIKMLVISGAFVQRLDGPADLLIVGDDLKRNLIDQAIKNLEAETGRELVYAVFDTSDFMYRYHSSDRFIRDLFEFEHERLVDKIAI